jgi:hypothetical protein
VKNPCVKNCPGRSPGCCCQIIAEQQYLRAVQHVFQALKVGDVSDASTWSQIQDRFFRECQVAGKAFGLTPGGE